MSGKINWVVVHKAVNSEEVAPKQKHVRKIIIATWKANGGLTYYANLAQEPLDSNVVVAWKALVCTHKVLQDGSPKFLHDSHTKLSIFTTIESVWQRAKQTPYTSFVVTYAILIKEKILFHATHPELPGNLAINEFVKRTQGRFDIERGLTTVKQLNDMQDSILRLEKLILTTKRLNECTVSAFIPLVIEAFAIYTLIVHFLKKISDLIDNMGAISKVTETFYTHYIDLRTFFEQCSRIRYVTDTIAVPMLPKDPPSFLVAGHTGKVKQVQAEVRQSQQFGLPTVVPLAMPSIEVKRKLNPVEMEQAIAISTPIRAASTVVPYASSINPQTPLSQSPAPPVVPGGESNAYVSVVEPRFLSLRDLSNPKAYNPFGAPPQERVEPAPNWTRFSSPYPPTYTIPYTPPIPASQPQQAGQTQVRVVSQQIPAPSLAHTSAPSQGLRPAPLPPSSPTTPSVKAAPSSSGGKPLPAAPASTPDMSQELLAKLKALQQELQKEKEKNALLEQQLTNKNEQLEKWKNAYSDVLAESEAQKQELDQLKAAQKAATLEEIDNSVRDLDQSLIELDSPTHHGNESATPDSVLSASEALVNELDGLLKDLADLGSEDASKPQFMSIAKAIRGTTIQTTELMANAKGAAQLTDDDAIRQALFDAARGCGISTTKLLDALKNTPQDKEAVVSIVNDTKRIAHQAASAASSLLTEGQETAKDSQTQADLEAEEANKLTNMATTELGNAVSVIEEAVRAINNLTQQRAARKKVTQSKDEEEEQQIADAILSCTVAVTNATSNLIKNAAKSQADIVEKGKSLPPTADVYNKNKTWSEGLISAARAVAATTQELVKQANGVVNSQLPEEGLIACSKAVVAATTQLVVAARVRGDSSSESQIKLEEAASAINNATRALTTATQAFSSNKAQEEKEREKEKSAIKAGGMMSSHVKKLETQMMILKLEKDLENARRRYHEMNQAEYQK